jgi:acyl carrier protein
MTNDTSSVLQTMKLLVQRELGLDPQHLDANTSLSELGDSLDWLNLLAALEEQFELRVTDVQAARLHKLGDLVLLVQQLRGAAVPNQAHVAREVQLV